MPSGRVNLLVAVANLPAVSNAAAIGFTPSHEADTNPDSKIMAKEIITIHAAADFPESQRYRATQFSDKDGVVTQSEITTYLAEHEIARDTVSQAFRDPNARLRHEATNGIRIFRFVHGQTSSGSAGQSTGEDKS